MVKFEEDDALKTYQHNMLYSKKKVHINIICYIQKKKLNYQPVKIGEVIILQITLMLIKEQMII